MNERIKLIRAMDLIARCVNDEYVFEYWLSCGVADGDINDDTEDEELEFYAEDDEFSELMGTFLELMKDAHKRGGLYCDHVLSKED